MTDRLSHIKPDYIPSGKSILVTGGAGFIGSHLVDALLSKENRVVVIDNFNDFYNPDCKRDNIKEHIRHSGYTLIEGDIRDKDSLERAFSRDKFDTVVHLAAMAGVRPSLSNPSLYMDVNIGGTQNLLDLMASSCPSARLVFGSSSSIYGRRSGDAFLETDRVDQPLSPYAASKAAGELLCYTAHDTTGLDCVCLRFFTVFGPRQRPDLAIHKFCRLIDAGQPIEVYGDGSSQRDYTYVSDIAGGILAAMQYDLPGYDIINLGRSEPVLLKDMIATIEEALGKKADTITRPFQTGDMPYTYASIDKARKVLKYEPCTSFEAGVRSFVAWYRHRQPARSTRAQT